MFASGLAIFVDLQDWKFAQAEAGPENVGWFLNTGRSVWDVFRGIIRRGFYPHVNIGPLLTKLRQSKTEASPSLQDENWTQWTSQAIVQIQYTHS